jgi:hypothetical protein
MSLMRIWFRMIIGFSIGFLGFGLGSILLLDRNGWFDVSSNPFAGPPPLMTASVIGLFGGVSGSLLSLFQWRRKKE